MADAKWGCVFHVHNNRLAMRGDDFRYLVIHFR